MNYCYNQMHYEPLEDIEIGMANARGGLEKTTSPYREPLSGRSTVSHDLYFKLHCGKQRANSRDGYGVGRQAGNAKATLPPRATSPTFTPKQLSRLQLSSLSFSPLPSTPVLGQATICTSTLRCTPHCVLHPAHRANSEFATK